MSKKSVIKYKATGAIAIKGWDIPVYWAVDKNGGCYMSGGHGSALSPTSQDKLLKLAKKELDVKSYNHISEALELSGSRMCSHCGGTGQIMEES